MIDEKRLLRDVGFYAHMCPCGEQASKQFLTNWIKEQPTVDMQKHEEEIRADERAKTIKDLYASDKSSTLKELLNQARADEIRKFAEWLPQHFDLRFSNNPDVWVDEFFNHTRDKILAEYKKREAKKGGADNGK